ncbi:hypothetical protein [Streptomyces nojiriensis]|uniref:hypothetical protein n=1 Tax=Streptomyces nojiriensis TaxID=66374 RepID=UPI0035DFA78C
MIEVDSGHHRTGVLPADAAVGRAAADLALLAVATAVSVLVMAQGGQIVDRWAVAARGANT